ncbi:hypothetical protein ACFV9P_19855 [Streptomyces sp. NPDC059892]|uniref:hypothetical protein n=1 Tax=unclassified Streptomyces TaxID=2593676 RepID=UPI0036550B37
MPKTGYVYVPSGSKENLEIGLAKGLWGWRSSALDRAGAREAVLTLTEGDFLVLAHKGPNSRVPAGGWKNATIKKVTVTQVVRSLFAATTPVWPDDDYPERIGIDVLDEESDISGEVLGGEAMESLRLSANKQGAAVLLPGTVGVLQLATGLPPVPSLAADAIVDHEGEVNSVAQVLVRREQQKIRRTLLGNVQHATCALCQRVLPIRFIRAAHIKRRSSATRAERLMMANIMPACLMGCDELFEQGHIYVTDDGMIVAGPRSDNTPDLRTAADLLAGRRIADWGIHRAPYFAWHRENIAC